MLVGTYGVSEIIGVMKMPVGYTVRTKVDRILPRAADLFGYWKTIIRSGIIGVIVGAIPGVGEDTAAWISYDTAKRSSKNPQEFGHGSYDGLIAAETGNNACIGGAIIPVLTLAIPGSAPAAVLLAAMWLHGIRPGPLLPIEQPHFIGTVTAIFMLATIAMTVLGLSWVRPLVKVLTVPRTVLMPIVLVLCTVGAYAINGRLFDIYLTLLFGVIGYFMRSNNFPAAPLVLGFILGPMADDNLRRALVLTGGQLTPFFTRPICQVLWALTLLVVLSRTPLPGMLRRMFSRKGAEA